MLSEAEVAFVSVVLMAIMNGIHIVTFLLCLRWQIYSDADWKNGIRFQSTIIVTILAFAFSITNLSICLGSFLLAMRGNNNLVLTGVLTSLSDALITLGSITTDAALTYRCWVIHSKRWPIIVLPVVLILYNFSVIITVSYWNSLKAAETRTSLYTLITQWKRVLAVQEGYLFATIAINLYTTSAIIINICRNKMPGWRMHPSLFVVIRVVAESGLLYTVTGMAVLVATFISLSPNGSQLPLIISYVIRLFASTIMTYSLLPVFPLPGIASDLLLLRVALNRVEDRHSSYELQLTTVGDKSSNAVVR